MDNIAPDITRQRLLIEGYYTIDMDAEKTGTFMTQLADHLGLRHYAKPMVHAPGGSGKDSNQGFDAFLPLIDSGISLYVWTNSKFFACVLFTCKAFDVEKTLSFTEEFFRVNEIVHKEF